MLTAQDIISVIQTLFYMHWTATDIFYKKITFGGCVDFCVRAWRCLCEYKRGPNTRSKKNKYKNVCVYGQNYERRTRIERQFFYFYIEKTNVF